MTMRFVVRSNQQIDNPSVMMYAPALRTTVGMSAYARFIIE